MRKRENEKKGSQGPPLLTQPRPEAADRVAPSRPRTPSTVLLVKPEHVDSDRVLGARAQSCGRVPQEQLGVLVPRQGVGGRGQGGPGRGRVAAARIPEQQQKQRQQRQQLGPLSQAGPCGATGHGGWRRQRAVADKEKEERGRPGAADRSCCWGARGQPRRPGGCGARSRVGQPVQRVVRPRRASPRPAVKSVQSCAEPSRARAGALPLQTRASKLCSPRRGGLGGFEGRGEAGQPAAPSWRPGGAPRTAGAAAYTTVPGPRRVRAPVCGGASARAQGCVPEWETGSVGGVGVGERAPRAPAESRRPATRAAPVCRHRSRLGTARGLRSLWRGARLLGCPCNGMR